MKKAKIILGCILISLIPAILSYLGTSNNILDILVEKRIIGESVDIEVIKESCLIANIIFTFLILLYSKVKEEIKISNCNEQLEGLVSYCKELLCGAISKELGGVSIHINIRIFVPCDGLLYHIRYLFNRNTPLYYKIRNVKGLAETDITNNLKFQVRPNDEGLVGMCYRKGNICYDTQLKENNSSKYSLNNTQIAKTSNLAFSMVVPITDSGNNVIAIMAFDSKQKIDKTKEVMDKISEAANAFAQLLYEKAPELFQRKGGQ